MLTQIHTLAYIHHRSHTHKNKIKNLINNTLKELKILMLLHPTNI